MVKREVPIPADLAKQISEIIYREGYTALMDAFTKDRQPPVFLSKEEAEALINLAVIEKRKAWLKYPYYDESHPRHSVVHEEKFDDVQMGIYEKTIYYVGSAFKEAEFDISCELGNLSNRIHHPANRQLVVSIRDIRFYPATTHIGPFPPPFFPGTKFTARWSYRTCLVRNRRWLSVVPYRPP